MFNNKHLNNRVNFLTRRNLNHLSVFVAVLFLLNLIPSLKIYLLVLGIILAFISFKNLTPVIVAICLGGEAFLSLYSQVTKMAASKVIVSLVLVVFLLLLSKRGLLNKANFHVCGIWIAFVYVFVVISYFIAPKTNYNDFYFQFFVIYVTFACLCGLSSVSSELKVYEVLLPSILFFACVYPLYGLALWNMPGNVLNSSIGLRGYLGFNSIGLGRAAGSLIILVLCTMWSKRNSADRKHFFWLSLIGFFAALPILWLSQTRQAVLAVFATIILGSSLILIKTRKMSTRFSLLVLLLPLFFLTYSFYTWSKENLEQNRMYENLGHSPRIHQWEYALKGILANPIAGNGLGGYYARFNIWPHNWILEAWYDYGLLGLLLFLVPILILLKKLYQANSESNSFYWLLLGFYWLLVAQASADIPRNYYVFFFLVIAFFAQKKTDANDLNNYRS